MAGHDINWTSAPAKKKVVFCVPGRTFSNHFLQSWTETLHDLVKSGSFDVMLSNQYASCVHIARAKCLGLSVDRGPVQKPWNGTLPYDVLVWIDSDMVFRSRDVLDLIRALLIEPDTDDAVETSIADAYRNDRKAFEKQAKDWVKRYASGK